ncbi:MAG: membrane integrity-associated transporter subunit PqiC [Acetobacteraceae bacterium]|nr:membrane integrity-associated transporter subunit PqiC [Acetobacteraceae bacterium]
MRRAPFAACAAVALALAGCSPNPAYYSLAPVTGAPGGGGPRVVELRRVSLAGYLDRQEMVLASQGYRLRITPRSVWAEPPADMIGRILAENLSQRLPGTVVFREATGATVTPRATVAVSVQRFDAMSTGPLVLRALVIVSRRNGHGSGQVVTLTVPREADTPDALVASMSAALGQLADRIAGMVAGGAFDFSQREARRPVLPKPNQT